MILCKFVLIFFIIL